MTCEPRHWNACAAKTSFVGSVLTGGGRPDFAATLAMSV